MGQCRACCIGLSIYKKLAVLAVLARTRVNQFLVNEFTRLDRSLAQAWHRATVRRKT